jgi:hypothetical protein
MVLLFGSCIGTYWILWINWLKKSNRNPLNQPIGTIETLLVFELLILFIPPVDRATHFPVARSPVCFRRWKMRKSHASNRLLGLKLFETEKKTT